MLSASGTLALLAGRTKASAPTQATAETGLLPRSHSDLEKWRGDSV